MPRNKTEPKTQSNCLNLLRHLGLRPRLLKVEWVLKVVYFTAATDCLDQIIAFAPEQGLDTVVRSDDELCVLEGGLTALEFSKAGVLV